MDGFGNSKVRIFSETERCTEHISLLHSVMASLKALKIFTLFEQLSHSLPVIIGEYSLRRSRGE